MDIIEDINEAMRLDGNAVAGEFQMHTAFDITTLNIECSHCHKEGVFARLLAYARGPGIVLRCPTCGGMVIKLVKTPSSIILNVEGIADGLTSTIIPQ